MWPQQLPGGDVRLEIEELRQQTARATSHVSFHSVVVYDSCRHNRRLQKRFDNHCAIFNSNTVIYNTDFVLRVYDFQNVDCLY